MVKRYVGRGRLADAFARLADYDRQRAAWQRDGRRAAAERRARPSRLGRLLAAADAVLAGWLAAAGYHRPNRGPWRKRRGTTGGTALAIALAERRAFADWDAASLARASGPPPADAGGTGKPDPAAVAAYLAGNPAAVARFGDLSRKVLDRYAAAWGGGVGTAAVVARADELRRGLAGECPNPVEVLLAERAALCWVAAHLYELTYDATNGKRLSFAAHGWHERRIDAAHRRLLAALKALAAVRRLRLPDVLAVVQVAPAAAPRQGAAEPVMAANAPAPPRRSRGRSAHLDPVRRAGRRAPTRPRGDPAARPAGERAFRGGRTGQARG